MMTGEQILLVKRTWIFFRGLDPVLVGDVFYSKLFLDAPELKPLFHTAKEEQSKKIVDMLSVIVGHLHILDELNEDISQLARRHVHYGVRAHHYKLVGTALLWMLQHGLGQDWNEKVKEAWAACFSILSESMIKASGYSPGTN
jgi:hemoglobin-like flavoprotein